MHTVETIIERIHQNDYKVLRPIVEPYVGLTTLYIFNDDRFLRWSFAKSFLSLTDKQIDESIFSMLLRFTGIGEKENK